MAAALFETCGIRTILQARTVSTHPFLGIGQACCHRRIRSDFIANIKVLLVAAAFGLATGSSDERPLASAAARKRCRFRSRRSYNNATNGLESSAIATSLEHARNWPSRP